MKVKKRSFSLGRSFVPLFVFLGGGIATLLALYLTPPPGPQIAAAVAMILSVLFVVFIMQYRSGDRASLGATGPAIVGPILAHIYVQTRAPSLKPLLAGGGDQLIQIAFFFASLIGAVVYMFVMFGEESAPHRTKKLGGYFGVLCLILFALSMVNLTDNIKPAGPPIAFGIEAPPVTILTLCRIGLVVLSLFVALWPKSTVSEVCSESAPRSPAKSQA